MNRDAGVRARVWGAATAVLGSAFLVRPHLLAGLVTGGDHTPENAVVRVLGGRQLLQGVAIAAAPSPLLVAGGVAVDLIHATSMVTIAALDARYRRAALISAGIAAASGVAGISIHRSGSR